MYPGQWDGEGVKGAEVVLRNLRCAIRFWMRRLSSGTVTSVQSSFWVFDLEECFLSEPECFFDGIFPSVLDSALYSKLELRRRLGLTWEGSDELIKAEEGLGLGVDSAWGSFGVSGSGIFLGSLGLSADESPHDDGAPRISETLGIWCLIYRRDGGSVDGSATP